MKKVLLLFTVLILSCCFAFAQIYQLPNGGFEDWYTNSNNKEIPSGWHTFD